MGRQHRKARALIQQQEAKADAVIKKMKYEQAEEDLVKLWGEICARMPGAVVAMGSNVHALIDARHQPFEYGDICVDPAKLGPAFGAIDLNKVMEMRDVMQRLRDEYETKGPNATSSIPTDLDW